MNIRENLQDALKQYEGAIYQVGCNIEERYLDTAGPQELLELHALYMRLEVAQELLAGVRHDLTALDRHLK